jgi:hypothetical protein
MRVAGQVLLVVCWPLEVLYWLAAGLYRLQLRYLGVTWRLMRGKYQVGPGDRSADALPCMQQHALKSYLKPISVGCCKHPASPRSVW